MNICAFHVQLADQRVRVVLHTRTNKMIYARFWLNGIQRDLKTGQYSERPARKHAALLVEAAGDDKAKNDKSLAAVLDTFYEKKWPKKEGSDYSSTKSRLTGFSDLNPEYHNQSISEATAAVQAHIDKKHKDGAAPRTIKAHVMAIHRFSAWMIRRRIVPWIINPAAKDRIERPPCAKQIDTPLTQAEIARFTAIAAPLAIFPAVVLVMSGCRPKAALDRIRWEDINFDAPNVKTFEKNVERFVDLSDWAKKELEARKGTGKVWPENYFTGFDALRKAATQAKTPNVSFQALRRSLVWLLWREGVPLQEAAKLCGHTAQTAARYYADANDLDGRAAASKISLDAFGSRGVAKSTANKTEKNS